MSESGQKPKSADLLDLSPNDPKADIPTLGQLMSFRAFACQTAALRRYRDHSACTCTGAPGPSTIPGAITR